MSSRREFFTSLVGVVKKDKQKEAFAPFAPFFDSQKADICKTCDSLSCVNSCEEGIIKKEAFTAPRLDFSRRGCTFCADCAVSCERGVFDASHDGGIDASVEIDALKCLAYNGVICKSCFDPCLERAIDFSGLFYPIINPEKCTACGFCIGVCPASAIIVQRSRV